MWTLILHTSVHRITWSHLITSRSHLRQSRDAKFLSTASPHCLYRHCSEWEGNRSTQLFRAVQWWKRNTFRVNCEPSPFCEEQLVSLSSLWATGLLNYSQHSASLFHLAQIQICFSAELLKLTVSSKPWLLILELLSTVLSLPKINSCCNKLRFCVVKSFHSQIIKCHASWTDYLCMFFPIPWLAAHWATLLNSQLSRHSPPAEAPFMDRLSGTRKHTVLSSGAPENGAWICASSDVLTKAWSLQSQ